MITWQARCSLSLLFGLMNQLSMEVWFSLYRCGHTENYYSERAELEILQFACLDAHILHNA